MWLPQFNCGLLKLKFFNERHWRGEVLFKIEFLCGNFAILNWDYWPIIEAEFSVSPLKLIASWTAVVWRWTSYWKVKNLSPSVLVQRLFTEGGGGQMGPYSMLNISGTYKGGFDHRPWPSGIVCMQIGCKISLLHSADCNFILWLDVPLPGRYGL